jgi:hypothetical protein
MLAHSEHVTLFSVRSSTFSIMFINKEITLHHVITECEVPPESFSVYYFKIKPLEGRFLQNVSNFHEVTSLFKNWLFIE